MQHASGAEIILTKADRQTKKFRTDRRFQQAGREECRELTGLFEFPIPGLKNLFVYLVYLVYFSSEAYTKLIEKARRSKLILKDSESGFLLEGMEGLQLSNCSRLIPLFRLFFLPPARVRVLCRVLCMVLKGCVECCPVPCKIVFVWGAVQGAVQKLCFASGIVIEIAADEIQVSEKAESRGGGDKAVQ